MGSNSSVTPLDDSLFHRVLVSSLSFFHLPQRSCIRADVDSLEENTQVVRALTQTLKIISVLVVSGIVVVGSVAFFDYWTDRAQSDAVGRPVTVEVTAEDTGSTLSDKLTDSGLVKYGVYFETRYRFAGAELQPGTYTLRRGMSVNEIINAITVPDEGEDLAAEGSDAADQDAPAESIEVTFIEGQRVEEYATTLVEAGWTGDPRAFIDLTNAAPANPDLWPFLADLPEGAGLQGFLFPDTYTIAANAPPQDVIDNMLSNFDLQFNPEMRQRAEASGMSVFEIVTVASIVEREAGVPEERPTIAAVYLNRLEQGEQLQADPTKQYAVGTEADWWPQLNGDLIAQATNSPYDTYIVEGLPPGPIANPGIRSIQGVLQPDNVDFLYMVGKNDGSNTHAFTNSLEEHEQNICTYDPEAEICAGARHEEDELALAAHPIADRRSVIFREG